jgi:hypothetical protein
MLPLSKLGVKCEIYVAILSAFHSCRTSQGHILVACRTHPRSDLIPLTSTSRFTSFPTLSLFRILKVAQYSRRVLCSHVGGSVNFSTPPRHPSSALTSNPKELARARWRMEREMIKGNWKSKYWQSNFRGDERAGRVTWHSVRHTPQTHIPAWWRINNNYVIRKPHPYRKHVSPYSCRR